MIQQILTSALLHRVFSHTVATALNTLVMTGKEICIAISHLYKFFQVIFPKSLSCSVKHSEILLLSFGYYLCK